MSIGKKQPNSGEIETETDFLSLLTLLLQKLTITFLK